MCTAVILRRPGHGWPLILAGNRDEMRDRPWRAPGRHWPDRPEVVAGMDELSGGSWLGVNDWGLLAAVLNRRGSLGPDARKRSRGELVLEALDHAEAGRAADALADLDPEAYRSFNLIVADAREAYWIRHPGEEGANGAGGGSGLSVRPVPEGVSMITASDMNDFASARIRRHLPAFRDAPAPDPDTGDWGAWQELLAARARTGEPGDESAMTVETDFGFETVSSALVALPAPPRTLEDPPRPPIFLFSPGAPDRHAFREVPH